MHECIPRNYLAALPEGLDSFSWYGLTGVYIHIHTHKYTYTFMNAYHGIT